eukprot:TRINITY_DN25693_c0_g1_i1.p1 TRINITY_DN25693_c0_g1~~TRINITY_DN25693_c0_g1_i1.p1  ORF type:complete len:968 (+),score=191.97 TRINITY_DN25693_c0_g1_i1:71-2905(+)
MRAARLPVLICALCTPADAAEVLFVSDSQAEALGNAGMYDELGPAIQSRLLDAGHVSGGAAAVHVSYDFPSGRTLATRPKATEADHVWSFVSTVAEGIEAGCRERRPDVVLVLGTVNTLKQSHWAALERGQMRSDVCAVVASWQKACGGAGLLWAPPLPFVHSVCPAHPNCRADWGTDAQRRQLAWDMLDSNISAAASGSCGDGRRPEYLPVASGVAVAGETVDGAHYYHPAPSATVHNIVALYAPRAAYWACLTKKLVDAIGEDRAREYCGGGAEPVWPTSQPTSAPSPPPASAAPSVSPSAEPTHGPAPSTAAPTLPQGATGPPSAASAAPTSLDPSAPPSAAPSAPPAAGPSAAPGNASTTLAVGTGALFTARECNALLTAGYFSTPAPSNGSGCAPAKPPVTVTVNGRPGVPNATWAAVGKPNGWCNGTLNSSNAGAGMGAAAVGSRNWTGAGVNATACLAAGSARLWSVVLAALVPFLAWEAAVLAALRCSAPGRRAGQQGGDTPPPDVTPPRARECPGDAETGEGDEGKEVAGTTQAPQGAVPQSRGIEGIRTLASLHIVSFHLFQTLHADGGAAEVHCSVCGFGKYQVQTFMLVSGYVSAASNLAKGVVSESTPSFLRRRLLPLWPLHALCIAFAAAYTGLHRGEWDAEHSKGLLLSLPLLQSWIPPFIASGLNGPAWFLSNLVLFWACFPHWMRAARAMSPAAAAGAALGVYAASWTPTVICYLLFDLPLQSYWYGEHIHNFIEFNPLCNWPAFALGLLGARLTRAAGAGGAHPAAAWALRAVRRGGASVALLAMAVFFAAAQPPGFVMGTYRLMVDKGPLSLPVLLPLVVSAHSEPMLDRLAAGALEPLASLGGLAWPLYITHEAWGAAAREALWALCGDTPYTTLWLLPAVLLGGAALLHWGVDRPARRLCGELERRLSASRGTSWQSLAPVRR